MALPLVLLSHPLPPEWVSSLDGRVRLLVGPASPAGFAPQLLDQLEEAEGILCLLADPVDQALLDGAPRLRVVSNMAVGFDNIDVAACTRRGIPVGNTPGILTDATADLTLALLLSIARGVPKAAMDARNGLWGIWSPTGWLGADLRGATLGIVGMGKIGQAVAQRAIGFGMKIIYSDPKVVEAAETAYAAQSRSLNDLLEESDIVSLHCPLTAKTRGMMDERAFKRMKTSAVFVNTARGSIVNQNALLRALREGWIAGAALDVTEPEPLPAHHALYDMENCLITPHIGSASYGARRRMAEIACENLLAGLDGLRLAYPVNPTIYKPQA